jgi:RimJ/RimL family protein N-acetyltransferase
MIRPLGPDDLDAYTTLRRRALAESPRSFAASPEDDFTMEALRESMRRAPDWMLLGAFDGALIGAVGLIRDRHRKASHKAHVWGMYVVPGHRGRGVGAALVEACIAHASSLPGVAALTLGVTDASAAARRLYERAGFQSWGTELDALRVDGQSVSQQHMTLDLEGRPKAPGIF